MENNRQDPSEKQTHSHQNSENLGANSSQSSDNLQPNTQQNFEVDTPPSEPTEESDKENVVSIQDTVNSLETKITETNTKYLRALADFENLKKRSAKEKLDTIKYSNESLLSEMLPVLDSLDKALEESKKTRTNEEAPLNECCAEVHSKWDQGTELLRNQLLGILEKKGLKKVLSKGQKFDPAYHQAIQKLESDDVQEETISEEFMAGYELNGRLIRPAMVLVAVPK